MKKILSIFVLSTAIYIPFTSNAAFMIVNSCSTVACKEADAKNMQIYQANLDAQKNADTIAAEKVLQEATLLKQEAIDVQNENQQKIKELEERISNLESKPTIVEKVITPTNGINTHNKEEVIKPTISDDKIVKPIIKKEEPKKEITEEKLSPIIETTTTTETPIISTNKSFFQRVFNWFKSLL